MVDNKPYLNYILNFRGLAIVFIVAYHTLISYTWNCSLFTKNIILSISSNGTILFVFIAGFLFYYLFNESFDYKEYLIKKLKFIILPYLIISIPAIVEKLFFQTVNHWWMDESYHSKSILFKTIGMILTGRHSGSLWFIPMISIFYILSPIFIRFSRSKIFDFSVLVISCAGLFTVSFGYYSNPLFSFIHFLPIYLIGMWACKFRKIILQNIRLVFPLILLVYLIMTAFEILQIIEIANYIKLRDAGGFNVVLNLSKLKATLFCFLVILFFYQLDNRNWSLLSLTGRYSFGIFFIHLYIIEGVQRVAKLTFFNFTELSLWALPALIIITLLLSIMITKAVKIIFKEKSRMIIGT